MERSGARIQLKHGSGGRAMRQLIEEVFLRTVSRFPTSAEMQKAKEDFAAAKTPVEGIRELLWAMLNTREFMVNH